MKTLDDIVIATQLSSVFAGIFFFCSHLIYDFIDAGTLGQNWEYFALYLVCASVVMLIMPHIWNNQTLWERVKDETLTPAEHALLDHSECIDQ